MAGRQAAAGCSNPTDAMAADYEGSDRAPVMLERFLVLAHCLVDDGEIVERLGNIDMILQEQRRTANYRS